ncbi:MAG: transporter, family, multidrug resistance protein [Candidatus Dependentiae bacterium]|nr:transporter, family, multidrug resistance protein [Candidatus Dependentiae bacterium]
MQSSAAQPALWLLFTLVGLPQFSETVYSPSLPDIAHALNTSVSMVEYTLTIYLFAFSLGMLFWGKISDFWGRKPSMLVGISIYLIGCVGCYFSSSIYLLLASRFVQAFGGSAGSVIGQAMCRDVFHGKALSRVYAAMSSALGVPPAVGPMVGGFIAEQWGWSYVFLLLTVVAAVVIGISAVQLPETLHHDDRRSFSLVDILWRLLRDKRVMAYAWCIGSVGGIMFSYFSEGSFYLIELLGLSPSWYGMSFIFIAIAMIAGGRLASYLHDRYEVDQVLNGGVWMMIASTGIFSCVAVSTYFTPISSLALIGVTLATHMVSMAGRCLVNSSALSVALADYRWCSGTASSVLGFIYYLIAALMTFGIGLLHNGTPYVMPLYFLAICVSMLLVRRWLLSDLAEKSN